jgi:hypothetical protein
MDPSQHDIDRIYALLEGIEEDAKSLRWAEERPWTRDSHIWLDARVVTVDMHDLNAALAKKVIAVVAEMAQDLEMGCIVFVTGWGKHSVGMPVLPGVVSAALVRLERGRGWRMRTVGSGRYVLVINEERAPATYRSNMPLGIRLFLFTFLGLLVWAAPPVGIGLAACVLVWLVMKLKNKSNADSP